MGNSLMDYRKTRLTHWLAVLDLLSEISQPACLDKSEERLWMDERRGV